jgi:hypothetical protein
MALADMIQAKIRRGISFSAAALLFNCLFTQAAPAATETAGEQPGSWGVNAHTPNNAAALKAIGTQWVRVSLPWHDVESGGRGRYDWSNADKKITPYVQSGLNVICTLTAEKLNPLYSESAGDKAEVSRAIARWMGAVALRFKGKGVVWEIGNEPEVFPMGGYWNNAATYTEMARLSAKAIKQSDSAAKTAALSVAWMDKPYITAALNAGLLNDGTIDYLSFHGYHRKTIEPESGLAEDVEWFRSSAAAATPSGRKTPTIIDTETGYSLAAFEAPKDINSWRISVYSEEAQAAYLARHFIEEISLGLPISIWYKDMYGENGYSLYYSDAADARGLRPMGRAFRTLATLLPGNPAALRNDNYKISVESMWRAAAGTGAAPRLYVRSFLRTSADKQQTLIVAVWNAVEAFDGSILASRTFTSKQSFESWRTIDSSDPVNVAAKLSIDGLGATAIQSSRLVSLPNGESTESPKIDTNTNATKPMSSLTITAKPMPTLLVITLRPVPVAPSLFPISR